jgi:GNAT superfamily N-acetyltransferase
VSERRQFRAGADGVPAISFIEDVRDGRPKADLLEAVGPGAADVVMSQLRGWSVAAPVELARELLARGARLVRHAHEMRCDLASRPPAPADPPEGFRFVPCDRPPRDVLGAWLAAYPPGHPDHRPRDEVSGLEDELAPLLEGRVLGAVLPCSILAVRDDDDEVVAGVVITDRDGAPWVTEVFRHPDRSPRGLGARLLSAAQARAEAGGVTALGLAVTEGNPARRVYERLGFTVTFTAMTVII